MNRILRWLLPVVLASSLQAEFSFVHPGLLHSRDDLERMRQAVAAKEEPTFAGYEVFRNHPQSKSNYVMRGPMAMVGRNPTVGQGDYDSDANTAYQCAIMWGITGDKAYADTPIAILNAWSSTLKSITGRDAVLMAGLGPFKMVNAAEIIRYTDAGWSESDIQQTERHFREVVYPVIKDFAPFANGNWDAAAIKTVMAIGVFCDDRDIFERGLHYYLDGAGDGRLKHYVINGAGQCQESGRDQQHTQLGLGLLAECCEIAWHQRLDLYGYDDNRLLKGFEYTARYNLGEDVPFVETLDRTGKYHHQNISTKGRGRLRAVFEQVYNHYVNRRGTPAPYTQRAAEQIRPEGPGLPGADHPGFGTLLFTRAVAEGAVVSSGAPASPAGLIAEGMATEIKLTWVASVGAKSYKVKRATSSGGPYAIVANGVRSNAYADKDVETGTLYFYTVSASNDVGESPDALETGVSAGPPSPWTSQDIGEVKVVGSTSFDGRMFTLEGAGTDIGSTTDQFQFASVPMRGDGVVTARFVPQVSSQFCKFGLMMRESSASDAAHVSLFVTPEATSDVERPSWKVILATRKFAGGKTFAVKSPELRVPTVLHGRLMGHVWLRLKRSGNHFIGSMLTDGENWSEVGTVILPLDGKLMAGLAACSCLETVSTTVRFDKVTAPGWIGASPSMSNVTSPDGKVVLEFSLQDEGAPAYSISYLGKPIVLESQLGLLPDFTNGFDRVASSSSHHAGQWTNNFGELRLVPDNYAELNVDLRHKSGAFVRLTFRSYDEGAAFRYTFPKQEIRKFTFDGELSEFRFPQHTFGYEEHGTEGEYRRVNTAGIRPWCERPLTLEYASGIFASLGEAATINYPRMLLSPLPGVPGALVSALGGETSNTHRRDQGHAPTMKLAAGESTPWRVFVVGKKPGDLLEKNYLILNLNPPSSIADASWIKPGKVIREVTLSTTGALACVDFAVKHGLQYVHFDAGWYGPEGSDPDATRVDPSRNLDLQYAIDYGASNGVGVILYVNQLALAKQIDILPALYRSWGVKGMKFGFVNVGSQYHTAWLQEAVRKCAANQIMVNVHDGYRATGNNRTWPNLMTVEGIRGNEHMPTPEHNCTLPFTRYVAGIGDYTVCYYNERIKTTHAHQLAMAVVSFSPLQWIFWYDKPSDYRGEPEIEFFREVPTVWDETKVVTGEIGQFATIARRSGDEWFIGTINNSEPRELKLPLDFLATGRQYTANIYSDNERVKTRTKVGIETRTVNMETVLDVQLLPGGGQAMWIRPDER